MNLHDVDVFNAIMITRGAGAAATLLDTSQPAISRSLAKLEAELGFKLFDRIRGRLVATREGELFHAEVKANLVGLDRLKLRAAQIKEVGTGTIRVASLSALGHGLVPRAIVAFSRKHPQVRISYQVRTSNVVRDLVASGSFDIGLAADEVDTSGVLHSVFNTPRAVCVMPKNHRLAEKAVITPTDLADEAFLALSPEDTVRVAIQGFRRAGRAPAHPDRDPLWPDDRHSCCKRHGNRPGQSVRYRRPHDRWHYRNTIRAGGPFPSADPATARRHQLDSNC
ncbi:MAG: LysR family transcriptional regulator [Mesorhizobium sp.]|nr:LysR substrate-binding domain-containing protein [Mesorhizobium sp.]RWQ03533.1 MAG: LysR family transcriptional regulator [Mesorhizobium sp.]